MKNNNGFSFFWVLLGVILINLITCVVATSIQRDANGRGVFDYTYSKTYDTYWSYEDMNAVRNPSERMTSSRLIDATPEFAEKIKFYKKWSAISWVIYINFMFFTTLYVIFYEDDYSDASTAIVGGAAAGVALSGLGSMIGGRTGQNLKECGNGAGVFAMLIFCVLLIYLMARTTLVFFAMLFRSLFSLVGVK